MRSLSPVPRTPGTHHRFPSKPQPHAKVAHALGYPEHLLRALYAGKHSHNPARRPRWWLGLSAPVFRSLGASERFSTLLVLMCGGEGFPGRHERGEGRKTRQHGLERWRVGRPCQRCGGMGCYGGLRPLRVVCEDLADGGGFAGVRLTTFARPSLTRLISTAMLLCIGGK